MAAELENLLTGDCPETKAAPADMNEEETGGLPKELASLVASINVEIEKANLHVLMHTAQRADAKRWIKEAENDEKNNKPMIEKTVTLTIEMSQNGTVPSLSGDQCGDFYYLSPLTQYIFGICINAKRFMDVYIWSESTTNRGADNIVSCLYWDLQR
jgi:hypothetical protein